MAIRKQAYYSSYFLMAIITEVGFHVVRSIAVVGHVILMVEVKVIPQAGGTIHQDLMANHPSVLYASLFYIGREVVQMLMKICPKEGLRM